ncbi:hypothetical protein [Kangiella sp. TOML190]|uniref:hypothetical protein n=1 Tax=Kangiella sp. TOML190 TaxID=2931351 RepID=UPI00203DB064|nr:hypothetical protein [Kangiella sp. TOML190]
MSLLFYSTMLDANACQQNLGGELDLLPPDIIETLKVVSDAFCEIQVKQSDTIYRVRVTGSVRKISEQAEYIYQCLKKDGCSIYQNQEAIQEYKTIKNISREKLEAKIQDQLKRNCYISKHLSNRAVDIGTRSMPKSLVSLLVDLLKNTEYYVEGKKYQPMVVDRSHGTGPHLHINFEPYYFNPAKCPKEYRFQTD